MKRRPALIYIIYSTLSLLFWECYAQEGISKNNSPKSMISGISSDLFKNNLKGHINNIKENCWYTKEKNGKLSKSKLQYSVFYKYDSMGNEVLNTEIDKDGWYAGDTINKFHSYKYDSNGRVIEMLEGINTTINDSDFTTKTAFKYNSKGEIVENYDFDEHLKLDGSSMFEYDSSGNLIVNEYYGRGIFDSTSERTLFNYNRNKVNKIYVYSPINILNSITNLKYDRMDNRIEVYHNYKHKNGSFVEKTKYDLNGNVVEQIKYNIRGKLIWLIRHKYNYDKRGNWIKEIYSENKKRPFITERKIEYSLAVVGR